MDLIIGRFADAVIAELSDAELDRLRAADGEARSRSLCLDHRRAPGAAGLRHAAVPAAAAFHAGRSGMANRPPIFSLPGQAADARRGSPTAPRAWSSPIWRGRLRRAPMRRRSACSWSAATARAWRRCRARLRFFAPDLAVLEFPAWDCLPYDRVSPHASVVAAAHDHAVAACPASRGASVRPCCSPPSTPLLQRVPPRAGWRGQSLSAAPGNMLDMDGVVKWLELNGLLPRLDGARAGGLRGARRHHRSLSARASDLPIRLDFFGDTLESIRSFDPESQRTIGQLRTLDLVPAAEFQLTSETIRRFRTGYAAAFGAPARDDLLYEAVSEGRRHQGMEHWLPLFHDTHGHVVRLPARHPGACWSRSRRTSRASAWRRSPTITRRAARRWKAPRPGRPISRCRPTASTSPRPNGATGWTRRRWRR